MLDNVERYLNELSIFDEFSIFEGRHKLSCPHKQQHKLSYEVIVRV